MIAETSNVFGADRIGDSNPGDLRQHCVRPRIVRVYRERPFRCPWGLDERREDERQNAQQNHETSEHPPPPVHVGPIRLTRRLATGGPLWGIVAFRCRSPPVRRRVSVARNTGLNILGPLYIAPSHTGAGLYIRCVRCETGATIFRWAGIFLST